MKTSRIGSIIGSLVLFSVIACTSISSDAPINTIDTIALKVMSENEIPALAIAIANDNGVVKSEAYGFADIEQQVTATRDSKFRLGSVSKVITASLVARLVDAELVDLDTDIRTYLPSFPDKDEVITLRLLLGHLGGIRHYSGADFDPSQAGGSIDLRLYADSDSILSLFAGDPLVAKPGEKYVYSTFGYSLIGLVLEAAIGKSYAVLADEYVFGPAQIDGIIVDDPFKVTTNRVSFYDRAERFGELLPVETYGSVVNSPPLTSTYKIPGGGLLGDAESVAMLGSLLFEPGFFSPKIHKQLTTSQTTIFGEPTGVGLGWRLEQMDDGSVKYHHSGIQQGARSHISVYPNEMLSIAVFSNLGGSPGNIGELADEIARLYLETKD